MKARPILFSGPMVRAMIADLKTKTRRIVKPQPDSVKDFGRLVPYKRAAPPPEMPSATFEKPIPCPYGVPGDLLWVRESGLEHREVHLFTHDATPGTWWTDDSGGRYGATYSAGITRQSLLRTHRVRPSIHMPRWASRLTLEITDVRCERVQDISETDAIAEGLYRSKPDKDDRAWFWDRSVEQRGSPPSQDEIDEFNEGVWMAPGAKQGWGLTKAERNRDTWGPTPEFCYRLIWEAINGKDSWAADPWVWAVSFTVHKLNVDALLTQRAPQ